ncbi:MAG: hypothetical protein OSJ72_19305 [Lachnospiraceae bacterium]|nr:hypothetical protein [Lachnospiraceae bacterium]
MARKRQIHDLGTFHKEAAGRGLTYAQAQIEETCDRIGPVRAPSDSDEGVVFNKVSTWNMLQKLAE